MKKIIFWILFIPGLLLIIVLSILELIGYLSGWFMSQMNKFEHWCFDFK